MTYVPNSIAVPSGDHEILSVQPTRWLENEIISRGSEPSGSIVYIPAAVGRW